LSRHRAVRDGTRNRPNAALSTANTSYDVSEQYGDRLVEMESLVTDPSQHAALYRTAQERFFAEVPALQFADARAFVAVRDGVRGFKLLFFGGQPFGGVGLAQ
jgi:dipeptide transport system substrate-binding protein